MQLRYDDTLSVANKATRRPVARCTFPAVVASHIEPGAVLSAPTPTNRPVRTVFNRLSIRGLVSVEIEWRRYWLPVRIRCGKSNAINRIGQVGGRRRCAIRIIPTPPPSGVDENRFETFSDFRRCFTSMARYFEEERTELSIFTICVLLTCQSVSPRKQLVSFHHAWNLFARFLRF